MEHQCRHEVDLALMAKDIHEIKQNEDIKDIKNALLGENGVVTQTALLKQGVKRIWWFVGGISIGLAGLAIKNIL